METNHIQAYRHTSSQFVQLINKWLLFLCRMLSKFAYRQKDPGIPPESLLFHANRGHSTGKAVWHLVFILIFHLTTTLEKVELLCLQTHIHASDVSPLVNCWSGWCLSELVVDYTKLVSQWPLLRLQPSFCLLPTLWSYLFRTMSSALELLFFVPRSVSGGQVKSFLGLWLMLFSWLLMQLLPKAKSGHTYILSTAAFVLQRHWIVGLIPHSHKAQNIYYLALYRVCWALI